MPIDKSVLNEIKLYLLAEGYLVLQLKNFNVLENTYEVPKELLDRLQTLGRLKEHKADVVEYLALDLARGLEPLISMVDTEVYTLDRGDMMRTISRLVILKHEDFLAAMK